MLPSIVTSSPTVEVNEHVVVATVPENVTLVFVQFSTVPPELYTTKLACSPSDTTGFAIVLSIVIPDAEADEGV